MDEDLQQQAEQLLGHAFDDPQLLKEALTHASVADHRLDSNERLEFLGDAVLDLVVCDVLFRQYPDWDEGEMTKIKSAVVSRKTCAEITRETGLGDLLRTGKGIGRREDLPHSLAANVYEAVVAAIYLDGGYDAADVYVKATMGPKIKAIVDNIDAHNHKATLQQAAQQILGSTPIYEVLDEKGPEHSKAFEVCVSVQGRRFPGAWGMSKKVAEQKASLLALNELGEMTDDELDAALEFLEAEAAD